MASQALSGRNGRQSSFRETMRQIYLNQKVKAALSTPALPRSGLAWSRSFEAKFARLSSASNLLRATSCGRQAGAGLPRSEAGGYCGGGEDGARGRGWWRRRDGSVRSGESVRLLTCEDTRLVLLCSPLSSTLIRLLEDNRGGQKKKIKT
jgi:hypothetical protein